jgi:hypothetical protein
MNDHTAEPAAAAAESQLEFLRALLEEHASIDLDVIEIRQGAWVIHGNFPYDGEEPMAVFDTRAEAQRVLDEVCGFRPIDDL